MPYSLESFYVCDTISCWTAVMQVLIHHLIVINIKFCQKFRLNIFKRFLPEKKNQTGSNHQPFFGE